ncbi:hypothetical protein FIV53_01470 [Mycoplasma nasistruthionis]|uniref:Uncharacterized protein n=1 Tax=Mycoplasma nasistruthionis TaxID=353852 RepID=A0A4Y6I6G7_9MOLU|nr:hypothetical protein FIV53_01470 [Mycoplasma nasistruthionis]
MNIWSIFWIWFSWLTFIICNSWPFVSPGVACFAGLTGCSGLFGLLLLLLFVFVVSWQLKATRAGDEITKLNPNRLKAFLNLNFISVLSFTHNHHFVIWLLLLL